MIIRHTRFWKFASILAVWAVVLNGSASGAEADAPIHAHWESTVMKRPLNLDIYLPDGGRTSKRLPVVFYLENLGSPRVGTANDEQNIRDWRHEGYLVAVLDFEHDPRARVPFINRDLSKIRDDIRYGKLLGNYKIDGRYIFLVPAGDRLLRNVTYYVDGKRTLGMDIIYPEKPAHPPAAVIEFSCDNRNRMGNTSLSICTDTMLDGEATTGFAVAMADHPVAAPYKGLDPMPACAWKIKAAVRTLRFEGKRLGFSGKIGVMGFSRGSGMALMLVTTDGMQEFEGHGRHQGISSSVQAAVVLSGRFTYLKLLPHDHMWPRYDKAWGKRDSHLGFWRREGALDYLQHATIPLFLSINCTEGVDALYQMMILRQRLAGLGSDATFMMDRVPRGHKVPLVPSILGPMNNYLKRQLESPLAVGHPQVSFPHS